VVQVDAIQRGLGGYVTGVDLSKPLADGELADIKAAWLDLGVLAFPDQALSPEQQAAFSAQFGELDVYPFMTPVQSHPNVIPIIKEPEAKMNFGGGWHTDTSYLAKPPKATVLYALETPPEGGDTLFADARAAFDTLSEGMQATLSGLTGVYSPKLVHGAKGAYRSDAAKESLGGSYDNAVDGESEVEHPLIRTHDDTGRRSIYCSLPHTHRIKGWTREESVPIFKYLMDHITQPEFVIRLKWTPGMLTIWDNRRVFHMAMNDYHGHRRHMQRVIVQGASPQ